MYKFIFTKTWEKDFKKLSKLNQERIIKKLTELKNQENIFHYLKALSNFEPYTHRIRVWNIRILLMKKDEHTFYVLNLWNRWEIYK